MSAENMSAVIYKANDLRLEHRPIPEINDYEALIHIDSVGLCGSDVKLLTTGKCGTISLSGPLVTGHEGSGIVKKIGSKVTRVKVGDRVAIEPTQPCRSCEFCKRGRYNLCIAPTYCSSPPTDGNLTTYYKHIADYLHVLPDNVTMEEGASVQPLGIAIHACKMAGITIGSEVLILGCGPIGILTLMVARSMGACTVVMTDVLQSRLDYAKKMGADSTLLVGREQTEEETVEKITKLFGGRPDVSVEACGFESAANVAISVTKSGGTVLLVGLGGAKVAVSFAEVVMRELTVQGSNRSANTYPTALNMVKNGIIDLKSYISHHFTIEQTTEAFRTAQSGEGMKVIVHVQPRDANNKKAL